MSADKRLFTPGPLTTSPSVKAAMMRDMGSRDREFIATVRRIRDELLRFGGVSQAGGYEAVLMQGSGTFGIEAVLGSVIPPDGKLVVLINGAYGQRMAHMARTLRIPVQTIIGPEDAPNSPVEVARWLADNAWVTHVAAVHCETTTGILNPIEEIGPLVRAAGARFIVDAMSSFGAVPLDMTACCIDFLISSANKCIEGVPGFAFVLARREPLLETEGWARSLSLDLLAQWRGLERDGQFRFTPPTHALLAFDQALRELEAEGGVAGRATRYRSNYTVLIPGMRELGFEEYLRPELQGYIITSFLAPKHPNFRFEEFSERLSEKGMIVYPGKLTRADCFRIGNIGRLNGDDIRSLLAAIRETLIEMELPVPLPREERAA